MIFSHLETKPKIDESATITETAVICGDVTIGKNTRIMYGATVIAEGGSIVIGDNCVVLENAVLRSTAHHSLNIGDNVLIGPSAHFVGCTVEDNVFIGTGAAVFHGARLCRGAEVRIHAVVHLKTTIPENETVPINWVAVGTPVHMFSPDKHDEIIAVQMPLNFPGFVYGVERKPNGETIMPEIAEAMTGYLREHNEDSLEE